MRRVSKVTQVKVNISNAVITIGGKNSTVVIGEGTLTINITSNNSIHGQGNALIDLVPSVTAIETVDKTIYILTPSVRAVIAPADVFAGQSSNVSSGPPPRVGSKVRFASNVNISHIFRSVTPTLSITAASIAVNGNNTDLSITIENTGNSSVELNGLMINGSKKVYFPQPPVSLLFHLPAMVMNLPILPPPGFPLPPGAMPPPRFVVTFPNGTVFNTTSVFSFTPPQNSTIPPLRNQTPSGNMSGNIPPPNGTVSQVQGGATTGKFYLLDLMTQANAISVNSTGVLVNVGGDAVIETSTLPMPPLQNQTPQQGGTNGQPPMPQNATIPAGSVTITLPTGTTLYIQFPQGVEPPSQPSTPPPSQIQNIIMARMILSNGTLGFPPMSLSRETQAQPGAVAVGSQGGSNVGAANNQASNIVANGAANLTVQIPSGVEIPKGYILAAGGTVTLSLNGEFTLGPAPQVEAGVESSNQPVIQPPFAQFISGAEYTISIFGASGAHTTTEVTAT